MSEESYPVHKEPFEVVCIREGVNPIAAKPEDFLRVPVEAADPLSARMHDDLVEKAKGFDPYVAMKPGIMTDMETSAYSRVANGAPTDRSKI